MSLLELDLPPTVGPLTEVEQEELVAHECVIQRGLKTFWEVGTALLAIRDRRLYRAEFGTFEAYCAERWGMTKGRANQLVRAAAVIENLRTDTRVSVLPETEGQARALASVPSQAQAPVWKRVMETAPDGIVTGNHVRQVVEEYREAVPESVMEPPKPAVPDLEMVAPARASSLIQLLPPVKDRGLHVPSASDLAAIRAESRATFNEQKTDNIEWARWSWNPVTGCLHNCDYCYARDIAARFYEQGFAPTFLPERLAAPHNTKVPARAAEEIGWRNVFVCSMADLWGKWVPTEVIELVLNEVRAAPQWNFLFLTKFPARYEEFAGRIPPNAWIGTSVDRQHAVHRAEKAFRKVMDAGHEGVRWLSCEPMLEPLQFTSLSMFNWVVVGGSSRSTQTPEFMPPFRWTSDLVRQADTAGCRVYMKTNLGLNDAIRLREYPGQGQ